MSQRRKDVGEKLQSFSYKVSSRDLTYWHGDPSYNIVLYTSTLLTG